MSVRKAFPLRLSPELLSRLNELGPAPENGSLYASAVTWMRTGRVMKTVGLYRNSLADACVVSLAQARSLTSICDIGASDGSASLQLLQALQQGFRQRLALALLPQQEAVGCLDAEFAVGAARQGMAVRQTILLPYDP